MWLGTIGAAPLPCVAGNDKAIAWHVKRIEINVEHLSLDSVELRIYQYPARLLSVPVLAYPMVFELAWREVCAEATARTRRHSLRPQDGTEQHGKMTADANHTTAGLARDLQWLPVKRMHSLQHFRNRTYMRFTLSLVGKCHAISEGEVAMK